MPKKKRGAKDPSKNTRPRPSYYVYVIELDDAVGKRVRADKPAVYVGQSAVAPEERRPTPARLSVVPLRAEPWCPAPAEAVSELQSTPRPGQRARDGSSSGRSSAEAGIHGFRRTLTTTHGDPVSPRQVLSHGLENRVSADLARADPLVQSNAAQSRGMSCRCEQRSYRK